MIRAICFRCGAQKSAPLKMCGECLVIPEIERHQLRSLCLSSDCMKQDNLKVCGKYLKKKKRLPKIHEKVIRRAQKKFRQLEAVHSNSQSMEFSSSFFDFGELEPTRKAPEKMVLVHVIGRVQNQEEAPGDRPKTLPSSLVAGRQGHQCQRFLQPQRRHRRNLCHLPVARRTMDELVRQPRRFRTIQITRRRTPQPPLIENDSFRPSRPPTKNPIDPRRRSNATSPSGCRPALSH